MLLLQSATVIALVLGGLIFSQLPPATLAQDTDAEPSVEGMAVQDGPPPSCHVTIPTEGSSVPSSSVLSGSATRFGIAAYGIVSNYGTDKLSTLLPTDGIWRGPIPRKAGDFAYSNKLPWFRVHPAFSDGDGRLTITGKRIDGPAFSFTETLENNGMARDEDRAMIMGGIDIPVFGCWEITGHYKDQELGFIVWVTPLREEESSSGTSSTEILSEPAASSTPPRQLHVDGGVEAKRLVYRVTPEIPHEAQVANVSGVVVLHAVITDYGRARELQYVSGPPLLARAAIDAVSWWQYMVTGERMEIDTTIEVVFPPATN